MELLREGRLSIRAGEMRQSSSRHGTKSRANGALKEIQESMQTRSSFGIQSNSTLSKRQRNNFRTIDTSEAAKQGRSVKKARQALGILSHIRGAASCTIVES